MGGLLPEVTQNSKGLMPTYLFNQFFTLGFNSSNKVFKFSDKTAFKTSTFLILIGELNRRLGVIFLNTEVQQSNTQRKAIGFCRLTEGLMPKCYINGTDLYLDITNTTNISSISIFGYNAVKWENVESSSFDPSGMTEVTLKEE